MKQWLTPIRKPDPGPPRHGALLPARLAKSFLRKGIQFFEYLEEPRFTIPVENFFLAVVMPLYEVQPNLLFDASNLLLKTAHALANGALVH